jgi:hypothetical protein
MVCRKVAKRTDPLYIAPPPPQNIAAPVSTLRRSRRQTQPLPIETDAALSGTVLPPPPAATVNVPTRRRNSRSLIPTSSTGTPVAAAAAAAAAAATTRRRSSRSVISTSSSFTPVPAAAAAATTRRQSRSRRQIQLPPIETREAELEDSDAFDDAAADDDDGDGDLSSPSWEDRLSELADFRKSFGHCNVPSRYSEKHQAG